MGETFKEFCLKLKKFFVNTVYIKDVNNNKPIDFSVREIKIENNCICLDGKKISLRDLSKNNIIIINGSVEKIENCQNVFVSGDANLIYNSEKVICADIEGDVICTNLKAKSISAHNINCQFITCEDVDGNIIAENNVKCKNVSENVISSGDVTTEGNIGGDVNAYDILLTGNVEGNVICNGNLSQKGDIFGDVYESLNK